MLRHYLGREYWGGLFIWAMMFAIIFVTAFAPKEPKPGVPCPPSQQNADGTARCTPPGTKG